ncbi:MAG: NACHT domain-containing NTPase [Coleofasciculaceae cyanobacterium]
MLFSKDFLTNIADEKKLTELQRDIFLLLFGEDKNKVQVANELQTTETVVSTRLTEIYKKFKITDPGPVKERELRRYLENKHKNKSSNAQLDDSAAMLIDELVREARSHIQPIIQQRCGTMRVLDMTQPIGLDKIYTHVNILEKITGRNRRTLDELLPEVSPEKFERFILSPVREKRVPGLEAVDKHNKLMILGKPGAGKTTFLKHLAMQCIGGKFQVHRVPIFITLKDFAETQGKRDLLTYIDALVHPTSSVETFRRNVSTTMPKTKTILDNGRALILLDGLDEVREIDANHVLCQIKEFSESNASNAFVITCRIAAREYTFEQFTEVEVADFDDEQIADVSGKWFHCRQDEVKAERFLQKLEENPPIRELASSPLLLTLLCLVFEDSGDFPANRSELYQDGVDVLLKKWDSKRNIERDQVYKKLSLKRKEDMLSQIAYCTFETGNYFFKQKDVERQIREFIENLPGASTDEETLNLDSEAVLKSIEAQHGLFVERARSIYSFSHLTFHEYFAAREIKEKSYFNVLSEHLTDKRWREVILLTIGMLRDADECLRQMKQAVDELLAEDEKLQQFLVWVDEKARSVDASYKPAAIRAFYFSPGRGRNLTRAFESDLACALDRHLDRHLNLNLNLDLNLVIDFNLYRHLDRHLNLYRNLNLNLNLNLDLDLYRHLDLDLYRHLDLKAAGKIDPELKLKLDTLFSQLPNLQDTEELKKQWWQEKGQAWTNQLRAVMIEHRNIGHNWQFSNVQKERLEQYYDANQLLVDCLNSDCYISRSVREEIEATLLLPIAITQS